MGYVKADASLCVGCRYCELVCVFNKEKTCSTSRTRIVIEKNELEGIDRPNVCRQCEEPMCVAACPTEALYKDEKTGVVVFVEEECIKCQACVAACPFGSIWFNEEIDSILKCDLCGGDPACVKICPTKALSLQK